MYRVDTSRQLDRGLGVSVVVDDENVQGAKAAGVPATLAGLARAQERFGRLALATVMAPAIRAAYDRSEEHTSELQSLMRISYAVFCLKKKKTHKQHQDQEPKQPDMIHNKSTSI